MSAATAPAIEKPANPVPETEDPRWRPVLGLQCGLTVDLPLPGFRVRDFLALHPGSVVGTAWTATRDVPLQVNGVLVGWGEMEQSTDHLAVRVTDLA